jgi:hypothetical protein
MAIVTPPLDLDSCSGGYVVSRCERNEGMEHNPSLSSNFNTVIYFLYYFFQEWVLK